MDNITIREAINAVQELYSKGIKSKDSRLSSRYIYSLLIKNRATILKQQINKNQSVSQWSYQSLNCIELESVRVNTIADAILRTVYKIPTPILGLGSSAITDITSIDGSLVFDPTSYKNVKYAKGKKYTSEKAGVYLLEQKLYITKKTKLEGFSLRGIFYDPIEAARFPSLCSDCVDCDCKDMMDYSFPVDGNTLDAVLQLCNNDVMLFMQNKEDKFNNANDDINLGNQMIHQPQRQQQDD